MKHTYIILCLFSVITLLTACKKEPDEKICWTLVDLQGVMMNDVCNKTEAEMNAQYGGQLFFFKASDPRYCWKLTKQGSADNYVRKVPQFIITQFFPGHTPTIVDCNSFCKWRVYFKHQSKVTGLYSPTTAKTETILNVSDTCGRLFVGRVVTVSETVDSIHTAEFIDHIDQY